MTGNLATEDRLAWLVRRLDDVGRVQISDAATELSVSDMTIRRDLRELEERGSVRRVRGGALRVGPVPFADRHRSGGKAKSLIAEKLKALVGTAGAVAFDASSTVMRLATSLDSATDLTVLTNGPDTFHALQQRAGVRAVLTGGELEIRTGSLVGPLASVGAAQLTYRRFFTSAAAVHPQLGATETCLEEADVKRAMAAAAEEIVLAVDSSKLGHRAVAVALAWSEVTTLVTELRPDDARLEQYRDVVDVL